MMAAKYCDIIKSRLVYILLGAAVLVVAAAAIFWSWQRIDTHQRQNFLNRAIPIASEIDLDVIRQFSGSAADLEVPAYQVLKRQLIAARSAIPEVRFIYLMGRRPDGSLFFYIDSEPPGSPDESPPGQTYTDVTGPLLDVFTSGRSSINGPAADDWGVWISALIPLVDPFSGDVIAVFGIDVDARDWAAQTAREILPPALLIAALAALLLAALVVLHNRGGPLGVVGRGYGGRPAPAVFFAIFGLLSTALLAWYGLYYERVSRQQTFEQLAFTKSRLILSRLHDIERVSLEGLAQFYAASEFVTGEEFNRYAASLQNNPLVSVWGWAPEVPGEAIGAFEASARAAGLTGYTVRRIGASGKLEPVLERDVHYPVLYLAPFDPKNPALGFDLGSDAVRRSALLDAKRTGLATATDPLDLVHGGDDLKGIVVFKPVPARNPGGQAGFVVSAVQMDRLVRYASGSDLPEEVSLYLDFLELHPGQPGDLLGSTAPEVVSQHHLGSDLSLHPGMEFTHIQPVFAFGKTYAVVAHPSPVFYAIYPKRVGMIVAAAGILLTIFITALVRAVTDWNGSLSRQVIERTRDLQESERRFQIALKNSPVVVFKQDRQLRYDWIFNPHPTFDPREVIGKTDAEMLPEADAIRLTEIKQRVLDTGVGDRQIVRTTLQGVPYYSDLTVDPVRGETGEIVGVTCSSVNITERLVAEDTLRLHSAALISSVNAVVITDLQGTIEWANPAFAALTGYAIEEVVGKNPRDLVRSGVQDRSFYRAMWDTILAGQPWQGELVNRRKDGSLYPEEMSLTPVKSKTGNITHFIAIKQDITERKQRVSELLTRNYQMQVLNEAGKLISQSLHLEDVYQTFYSLVSSLMSCDNLLIAGYDDETQVITAEFVIVNGERLDENSLPPIPLEPEGQGLVSPAIRSGESQLINDVTAINRPPNAQLYIDDQGVVYDQDSLPQDDKITRAMILVPLIFQNAVTGVIQIQSFTKNAYGEDDLRLAEAMVSQIAVAANNALLYRQTLDEIETRKQTEARLGLLLKREESIVTLSQSLADTLDIERIYEIVGGYFENIFDLCYLGISSVDEAERTLWIDYLTHKGMRMDVSKVAVVPYPGQAAGAGRENAVACRQVVKAGHGEEIGACLPGYLQDAAPEVRSALIIPLVVEDRVTGLLELYGSAADGFESADDEWLSIVANLCGLSLQNARSFTRANERTENLMALHTIDLAINSGIDLGPTIGILLEQVIKRLRVDAACVQLFDPKSNALRYYGGMGFKVAKYSRYGPQPSKTYANAVARTRQNVHIRNLERQASEFGLPPDVKEEGFVGYYGVPLIAKGRVKGVLEIYQRKELIPEKEWVDFVEILAGQSAIAIDTAEIFEDLQRSNMELTLAYDATIQGWSQALDLRDKETEGHTLRVTEMAVKFARKLGMTDSEVLHVRWGALLHDIGKIGVPDKILHKPEPLSEEEWEVMRRHPETALSLLANIEYLRSAVDIPYCHHEKWDGSGYPRGLKGREIPLAARLFAIIDVWDALASDRPYRAAWSAGEVMDYIRQYAGIFFDPELVPVFCELVQENQKV